MEHPDRVLFIRLSAIGDILLITPLIRLFSESFPQTQIDVLTREPYVPLLQHNPLVSRVIALRQPVTTKELFAAAAELRRNQYAIVVDLQKHWRSYFISWLSASKKILRYRKYVMQRFFLVHLNLNCYPDPPASVPERYFEALKNIKMGWRSLSLDLFIPNEVRATGERNWPFKDGKPVIAIAPGAGRNTKKWPAGKFVELIHGLHQKIPCNILLLGADHDSTTCEEIAMNSNLPVVNWCGKTPLLETADAIKRADLVVTHDTGLMHMAAAVQSTTLAIFGPTVKEFGFFPYQVKHKVIENNGLKCRPCSYHGTASCPKGHFKCMVEIEPGRVVNAALELLST